MDYQHIIATTSAFVQEKLSNAEAGHDWWHTYRVWRNAQSIMAASPGANGLVVELAALLHDIADSKFNDGDEEIGPATASNFLHALNLPAELVTHVVNIIRHMSFKGGNFSVPFQSLEMNIVQDADRLDAIGAIGIARAFHYGGFKNRLMYDPAITPELNMSKEAYKSSTAPTINHFYEKLLLLKDRMNTLKGKEMAEERHHFMQQYLDAFYKEWNGQ